MVLANGPLTNLEMIFVSNVCLLLEHDDLTSYGICDDFKVVSKNVL